jgi:hypothetical protein
MNIYPDIDGVLLANERQAAAFADEFLQAVLAKYPDTTYWLTTHCWHGENNALEVLRPVLKPATMELIERIKPTEWGELKTDAIDFSQPFLWFDDDLMDEERNVLKARNASNRWVGVDLAANPNRLRDLVKLVA